MYNFSLPENFKIALTFNDVILLPGWTEVEPREVDLSTYVDKNHKLNIPFVSSPMDTVTEADLAIALAREGGLGVLHRNCSVEEQVEMARKVKRAEAFVIRDVVTITPDKKVEDARRIMEELNIHGLPVVSGSKLVGLVTSRDIRYSEPNLRVSKVMTPRERLIVTHPGVTIDEAKKTLQKHKIEKLPLVDDKDRLIGLITYKDLELKGKYPNAVRDENGRLLVAAAISPFDLERAKKLSKYVDILVIDVAHFHNKNVFEATKKIIKSVDSDVIIGNLGTREAVLDAVSEIEDVSGLRVGIGSGSICTTGIVTRVAAPTLFAVLESVSALKELGAFDKIPIIADGGIKNSGDIAVALAAGASAVMMGNLFAGTRESPGRLIAIEGRYYKEYYGMGSARARAKRMALDRYSYPSKEIEEGIEGWVPYRGTVSDLVKELSAGLKAAMGYVGAKNIRELWVKSRFAIILPTGFYEIRPHDIVTPTQHLPRSGLL